MDWDRISKSLPRVRHKASDRAPTSEEIQKLVDYPDRAIKPLVYVMCSSGIKILD